MLPLGAAGEAKVMPYWPGSGYVPGLENNQYYTVVFDEEEEAAVLAKLEFQNTEKSEMKNILLEFSGQVQIINAVQEIRAAKEECYEWGCSYPLEYKYKTVDVKKLLSSYELTLAEPAGEQETATLIIYYQARGQVEKNLGVYQFNFETIKSNYYINSVQVAISVQEGLHLKGVEGNVNYVDNFFPTRKMMIAETMTAEMASYSERIGHYGGLTKHASGLDPFESFIVSGEYAKSRFWLNRWSWLSVLVIGTIVLLGISRLFSHLRRRKSRTKEIALWGFLSASLSMLVVGGSLWLIDHLRYWIGYQVSYQWSGLMSLFIGFAMVVIVLAALIIPPIYIGRKHKDFLAGIMAVAAMVGWLLVLSLLLLLAFIVF